MKERYKELNSRINVQAMGMLATAEEEVSNSGEARLLVNFDLNS